MPGSILTLPQVERKFCLPFEQSQQQLDALAGANPCAGREGAIVDDLGGGGGYGGGGGGGGHGGGGYGGGGHGGGGYGGGGGGGHGGGGYGGGGGEHEHGHGHGGGGDFHVSKFVTLYSTCTYKQWLVYKNGTLV